MIDIEKQKRISVLLGIDSEKNYELDNLMNEFCLNLIKSNNISDTVFMEKGTDEILKIPIEKFIYYFIDGEKAIRIPADIILSQTLPIRCIEINNELSVTEDYISDCKYKILIDENYQKYVESLNEEKENKYRIIGVMEFDKIPIYCPIYVEYGKENLRINIMGDQNMIDLIGDHISANKFKEFIFESLVTWYAIQISLLNPPIQKVFKNENLRLTIKPNAVNGLKKRKTIYKRKIIINKDDIEKVICSKNEKYHRKCLCWYTVGHWRHYKNGYSKFIQGYWKGKLRDLKKNIDDGRERELILNEGVH